MTPGRQAWIVLAVFALALVPRLWRPSPFVTWDEPVWTYRSLKFLRALQVGDLAGTNLTDHPGVVTMWVGATGMVVRAAAEPGVDRDLTWVDELPAFDEDDTALLGRIMPWWRAARAGIGVLTALLVAAAVALVWRVSDGRTAALAAVLLAFDPYLLAHARLLQLDGVLSGALLVAVLGVVGWRQTVVGCEGSERTKAAPAIWMVVAGACAGAAALEKSPALAIAPFTAGVVAVVAVLRHGIRSDALREAARAFGVWSLAAAATYVALWPAMWVDPVGTLGGMWSFATRAAGGAREAVFFWGAIQPDPGLRLYLVGLLFRLTPVALLGLVAAVPVLRRGGRPQRSLVVTLLAFAMVYTLFMGTNAKKFERYVLPVVPALDVVAAVGLAWFVRDVRRRARQADTAAAAGLRATLGVTVLVGLQAVVVVSHAPYYLASYNPLPGGGPAAAARLPVGWGEGMDLAADYLNALPDAERLVVATPSVALLAPLFHGRTVPARDRAEADYVVLYVDDVQIRRPEIVTAFHGLRTPEHVVRVNGIDYAWIYNTRTQ
jgi:4-amino-4-deoxy-L-arabinose transferase-like glycosyltransferase